MRDVWRYTHHSRSSAMILLILRGSDTGLAMLSAVSMATESADVANHYHMREGHKTTPPCLQRLTRMEDTARFYTTKHSWRGKSVLYSLCLLNACDTLPLLKVQAGLLRRERRYIHPQPRQWRSDQSGRPAPLHPTSHCILYSNHGQWPYGEFVDIAPSSKSGNEFVITVRKGL